MGFTASLDFGTTGLSFDELETDSQAIVTLFSSVILLPIMNSLFTRKQLSEMEATINKKVMTFVV